MIESLNGTASRGNNNDYLTETPSGSSSPSLLNIRGAGSLCSLSSRRTNSYGIGLASPTSSVFSSESIISTSVYQQKLDNVWSALCKLYYSENKTILEPDSPEFKEFENCGLKIYDLLFVKLRPTEKAILDVLQLAETENWDDKEKVNQALNKYLEQSENVLNDIKQADLCRVTDLSDDAVRVLKEVQDTLNQKSWSMGSDRLNDAINQFSAVAYFKRTRPSAANTPYSSSPILSSFPVPPVVRSSTSLAPIESSAASWGKALIQQIEDISRGLTRFEGEVPKFTISQVRFARYLEIKYLYPTYISSPFFHAGS